MSEEEKREFWINMKFSKKPCSFSERAELLLYLEKNINGDSSLEDSLVRFLTLYGMDYLFTDDELINLLQSGDIFYLKYVLIQGITLELLRIDYIAQLESSGEKKLLLERLTDEEAISQYLCSYANGDETEIILKDVLTEDERLSVIEIAIANDHESAYLFAKYLESDDNILKLIQFLVDNGKYTNQKVTSLVELLKSKTALFDAIDRWEELLEQDVYLALKKFNDDDKKIETLKKVTSHNVRLALVASLNDVEKKKTYLNEFEDDGDLFLLATSSNDVEYKMSFFPKIKNTNLKLQLALAFNTDENRMKTLKFFENVEDRVTVVVFCKSDALKYAFLRQNVLSCNERNRILISMQEANLRKKAVLESSNIMGRGIYDQGYKKKYEIYDAGLDALPKELTFGIEIELMGNLGVPLIAYGEKLLGKYDVKWEDSLKEKGVEFSSHTMTYKQEDLRSIYQVCEFARKNGLKVCKDAINGNLLCGGHIHYGIKLLDSYDAWFFLFYIYCKVERILYIISNREGKFPREGILRFAAPFSHKFTSILDEIKTAKTPKDFVRIIQEKSVHKTEAINLDNIGICFDTVEFRIPNGDGDPDIIVQNILLFGSIIVFAKKLSCLPLDPHTYRLLYELDDPNKDEKERLEVLLKMIFREEKNREVFRKRYKANLPLFEVNVTIDEDDFESFSLKSENIRF